MTQSLEGVAQRIGVGLEPLIGHVSRPLLHLARIVIEQCYPFGISHNDGSAEAEAVAVIRHIGEALGHLNASSNEIAPCWRALSYCASTRNRGEELGRCRTVGDHRKSSRGTTSQFQKMLLRQKRGKPRARDFASRLCAIKTPQLASGAHSMATSRTCTCKSIGLDVLCRLRVVSCLCLDMKLDLHLVTCKCEHLPKAWCSCHPVSICDNQVAAVQATKREEATSTSQHEPQMMCSIECVLWMCDVDVHQVCLNRSETVE